MDKKVIISTKSDDYVNTTIRIDKDVLNKYDEIAAKSKRSRNEIIGIALKYALDFLEIEEKEEN